MDNTQKKEELLISLENECGVLGSLMLDPGLVPEVRAEVKERDFSTHRNRLIFRVICELFDAGSEVDLMLVIQRLKDMEQLENCGGFEGISSLERMVFTTGAAIDQAKVVHQKSILRDLRKLASNIEQNIFTSLDPYQVINESIEKLQDLNDQGDGLMLDSRSFAQSTLAEIQERVRESQSGERKVNFNVTGINDIVKSIDSTAMVILAARPSVGKTSFAVHHAMAMVDRMPTAIFSLEMNGSEIGMKMVPGMAQVSYSDLQEGNLSISEMDRVEAACSLLGRQDWQVSNAGGITIDKIEAVIRKQSVKWKREGVNRGAFYVDYLQLIPTHAKQGQNHSVAVGQISRRLKTLALETGWTAFVLSQLSRESAKQDRPPKLDDLRDSGSLEQDADMVCFLHREGEPVPSDRGLQPLKFIVGKQRKGALGTIPIHFDPIKNKFTGIHSG